MSESLQRECPDCGTERTFYLAASTTLHLGEKSKWRCPECDWGFVRIDDVLETSGSA